MVGDSPCQGRLVNVVPDRDGEYLIMQVQLLGGALWPVAVLLFDPLGDRLHLRARKDLSLVSQGDQQVIALVLAQIANEATTTSGSEMLAHLEDTLSNTLRLTDRRRLRVESVDMALNCLFCRHITSVA